MTQKDNGGPAFPQKLLYRDSQGIDYEVQETGMTLRDWFAGQALRLLWGSRDPMTPEDAANVAYEIADAMLAERSE